MDDPPNSAKPIAFGDYLLIRRIGLGGFATVFEGELQGAYGFYKRVAVKVPNYRITSANDRVFAGFLNEARLGARIRHPNLVEFYECGRVGDRLYIAMELVEGLSLAQLLGVRDAMKTPMSSEAVVTIALGMARGLAGLHGTSARGENLGVVHRDLKPANVLLSTDGEVKISDYGVSRFDAEFYTSLGQPGALVGSPLYMSPELSRGEEPTTASDVFSFGSVVLEMLLGRPVFQDNSVSRILARVDEADAAEALAAARRDQPALASILETCLQPRPEDRHADGGALVEALKALDPVPYGHEVVAGLASEAAELLADRHEGVRSLALTEFWETLGAEEDESVAVPWGGEEAPQADGTGSVTWPRRPGMARRLPWIGLGLAAVLLLGWIAVRALSPPPPSDDEGVRASTAVTAPGSPIAEGAHDEAATPGDAGPADVEAPDDASAQPRPVHTRGAADVTARSSDPAGVEAQPLPLPEEDAAEPAGVEAPDDTPGEVRIGRVERGLRGQPFAIGVTVPHRGDHRFVVWFRAAPEGAWEALQFEDAAGGALQVPAGEWQAPGCDEVEYFVEVTGPGGMERFGSPVDPYRFRLH